MKCEFKMVVLIVGWS